MIKPKEWWFLFPVPVALLLTLIIRLFPGFIATKSVCIPGDNLGVFLILGLIFFPLGFFATFIWDSWVIHNNILLFIAAGWIVYIGLTLSGTLKPDRRLFLLLCGLLLLNVGGCLLPQAGKSIFEGIL